MDLALYVHVPFCVDRCAYCDFVTVRYEPAWRPLYVQVLLQEIRHWADRLTDRVVQSVYFGGGTPGLLHADEVGRVLDALRSAWPVAKDAEITVETTPWAVTASKLRDLRDLGVNRISVGLQAYDDGLLTAMGRVHRRRHIERANALLRAGAWNWNADLILGYPGQTAALWRSTVESLLQDAPPHVSLYVLEVHESTPLGRWVASGAVRPPSDAWVDRAWRWAYARFRRAGYRFYEVSNLARPGFESRHNRTYWRLGDYLGLGMGAHSCVGPYRWQNPSAWLDYSRMVLRGEAPARTFRDRRERLRERILLGLRTRWGIPYRWLTRYHGSYDGWRTFLDEAVRQGWLRWDRERLRATPSGWLRMMALYEGLGVG
jgi:oxygen-independent coproporphyrinogen-3 oxidase